MKTATQAFSTLTDWFKKHTEGAHIFQWINYIMIFSVLVVFIIKTPPGNPDWRFYMVVLALAAVLVLNILWFQYHDLVSDTRYDRLYHWSFNLVTDLLVLGAFALTGREEVVFLVFMQVAMFASFSGVWPGGVVFGLINLAVILGIIKGLGTSNENLVQAGSQIMVGMIFVLVFVLLVDRAQQETHRAEGLLHDLRTANLRLKSAHSKEKELAIVEERMRLARDIHDGLGHHLTVLSVQLQAAEKLVERSPQAAAEAIRISRAETQAALDEVRQSVGVMRQPPAESQPLPELLAGLVRDFGQHTGLPAAFEQTGTTVELGDFVRQTLFRAVQECLTNVQKHSSQVKQIVVRLEYTPEAVRLLVQNDGQPGKLEPARQPGFGLTGLHERVEQLGGSLRSEPGMEGGFEVEIHIPLEEPDGDRRPAG